MEPHFSYYTTLNKSFVHMCCVGAKSFQSYPTLCNLMDCNLPGSSAHGILQERKLEWAAIPFSRESSWPRDWTHLSYFSWTGRWILYHQCHLGSPFLNVFVCVCVCAHARALQADSLLLSHQGSPLFIWSSPVGTPEHWVKWNFFHFPGFGDVWWENVNYYLLKCLYLPPPHPPVQDYSIGKGILRKINPRNGSLFHHWDMKRAKLSTTLKLASSVWRSFRCFREQSC